MPFGLFLVPFTHAACLPALPLLTAVLPPTLVSFPRLARVPVSGLVGSPARVWCGSGGAFCGGLVR
eukprot:7597338-Alexandrium_andersonii.AAC.1